MTLILNIPASAEEILRNSLGENPDRSALEAIAADGYRTGKFSRYQVQQMLGFSNRWEFEEWMAPRGLYLITELDDIDIVMPKTTPGPA